MEEAGFKVVWINPKFTSQVCSRCSLIVKKDLSERKHRCDYGLVMNRDLTADNQYFENGVHFLPQIGIEAHALQEWEQSQKQTLIIMSVKNSNWSQLFSLFDFIRTRCD